MSFPSEAAIKAFPKLIDIDMDSTRGMGNFVLYTLVPLSDPDTFLKLVNEDQDGILDDDYVVFAPDYDFSNKTLDDIVSYHQVLTKGTQDSKDGLDYGNFIVAIHNDVVKHGVLVVDMVYEYYDSVEGVPALARCPVAAGATDENEIDAVSWCVNLQIANMDMYELLEQDQNMSWPEPLPGYDALQEDLRQSCKELKEKAREKYSRLPVRHERYVVHLIGDPNRDTGTEKYSIEPDAFYKEEVELENRVATTRGIDAFFDKRPVAELWTRISKEHPGHCVSRHPPNNPFWSTTKHWMFVVDKPVTEDNPVALVRAHWDGVTEGKSKEGLENIMPWLETVARCGTGEALARMDELVDSSSQ